MGIGVLLAALLAVGAVVREPIWKAKPLMPWADFAAHQAVESLIIAAGGALGAFLFWLLGSKRGVRCAGARAVGRCWLRLAGLAAPPESAGSADRACIGVSAVPATADRRAVPNLPTRPEE